MSKKGFTLLELLAVILILGVIALIAISVTTNIIADAKVNTFKSTASNFAEALYNKCTVNQVKGLNTVIDINILSNNNVGTDTLDEFIDTNGDVSKLLGQTDEKCNVSLAIYDDNLNMCAYKLASEDTIKTSNVANDYRCLLGANIRDDKDMYTVGYQSTDTSIVPTDGKCFSINKYNGYISGYRDDCPKDVIIPAYIDGIKTTVISGFAFRSKDLESVLMPETISYISSGAFSYNNITTVGLGTGVKTIVEGAFAENLITELTIPDSVTSLSGFSENHIEKITFGTGLNLIGSKAFYKNEELKKVDLSMATNLEGIYNAAFSSTGLEEIILPDSLQIINAKAFQKSKLTSITIPPNVTTIGAKAFDTKTLNEINIKNKTSLDNFTNLEDYWNGDCTNINFVN